MPMFTKTINSAFKSAAVRNAFLAGLLAAAASLSQTSFAQANPSQAGPSQSNPGQTKPEVPSSATALELPVVLQQKVIAGKTPVGTKVQAKLTVATLLAGVVIPQGAVISGEVIASTAKSAADPSRLAIRMDSVQFKNGATPTTVIPLTPKLYLTAWYYPVVMDRNTSDGVTDAAHNPPSWGGGAIYPGQRNPNSPPPSGPADTFPAPAADHRALMKNIDSITNSDGAVSLTSTHSTIKLDKSTTYVFALNELHPAK
jgi:hypothetical protein